jgi:hypothetical protein
MGIARTIAELRPGDDDRQAAEGELAGVVFGQRLTALISVAGAVGIVSSKRVS